jgi:maleate isomerase
MTPVAPPADGDADPRSVRVGVLVPSSNTMVERDAQAHLPAHVTAHFARMKITRDDPDQLAGLVDLAPAAAELVADADVAAIAFACTTGSLHGGRGRDLEVIERVEAAAGVPATTTATAVVDALAAVGAGTVALVSPYEEWLNDEVVDFLSASGVAVDGVRGFGLPDPLDIAAVSPGEIAAAVRDVDSARVDAILISCTAFGGVDAVRLVGDELGKPVMAANQVTFWKLARLAGVPSRPPAASGFDLLTLG